MPAINTEAEDLNETEAPGSPRYESTEESPDSKEQSGG